MRLCRDCYHDGCCEGLPYCGGTYFLSARVECDCVLDGTDRGSDGFGSTGVN